MPAPYTHLFAIKPKTGGEPGDPRRDGEPPWADALKSVLAGRSWSIGLSPTNYVLVIRDEPDLLVGEVTTLTNAHTAWLPNNVPVVGHRALVLRRVDRETRRRIKAGFTYSATNLSLSREAQFNWLSIGVKANRLTYPYTIRSRDDTATYAIVDATDAGALSDAAFDAVEAILAGGRTVKAAVVGAVGIAAIDAAAASWLSGGPP